MLRLGRLQARASLCELSAGLDSRAVAGTSRCAAGVPVAPVETVVVGQFEHDVGRGAIVHVSLEVVAAKPVVTDEYIVPAVCIADADGSSVDAPCELAIVVVGVAVVQVVVHFIAPSAV